MTVDRESILIVCSDSIAELQSCLGVSEDGTLTLSTKYYTAKISVDTVVDVPSNVSADIGAIIIQGPIQMVKSQQLASLDDDVIKLFLADSLDHLDVCIENGFELVPIAKLHEDDSEIDFGVGRIKQALECRMWSPTKSNSSCELNIDQFDDLMTKLKCIREACDSVPDDVRKNRAAQVAFELAKLLGDDDSD